MICENPKCGKEHDGSYGSGRFCSSHCYRQYTGSMSYHKRKENNSFVCGYAIAAKRRRKKCGWKCTICGEIFETRKEMQNHRKNEHGFSKNMAWNKGLTKSTCETIRKQAENFKEKYKNGEIQIKRRRYTVEERERLSEIRKRQIEEKGGFTDVGWYKIKNISGEEFTVRGTWELNIANILNSLGILWIRNKWIKYNDNGINRNYNPDFYLPEVDEYIEVKGYYSDRDKRKMELVMKQNDITLYFINSNSYKLVINESVSPLDKRFMFAIE